MIESAIEWIKGFFADGDNLNDIGVWVVTILIGLIFIFIKRIFKWLGKLFGIFGKWLLTKRKNKIEKIKEDREDQDYKREIGQIERGEIPVTDKFLFGKSPEKNPELSKIYQMMDDGVIESPNIYELQKSLKGNSLLDELKKDAINPPYQQIKPIKPPPFKK